MASWTEVAKQPVSSASPPPCSHWFCHRTYRIRGGVPIDKKMVKAVLITSAQSTIGGIGKETEDPYSMKVLLEDPVPATGEAFQVYGTPMQSPNGKTPFKECLDIKREHEVGCGCGHDMQMPGYKLSAQMQGLIFPCLMSGVIAFMKSLFVDEAIFCDAGYGQLFLSEDPNSTIIVLRLARWVDLSRFSTRRGSWFRSPERKQEVTAEFGVFGPQKLVPLNIETGAQLQDFSTKFRWGKELRAACKYVVEHGLFLGAHDARNPCSFKELVERCDQLPEKYQSPVAIEGANEGANESEAASFATFTRFRDEDFPPLMSAKVPERKMVRA